MKRHKRHESRKGQGLVEFALILPLLLLIILGIIEFGRAFYIYSNLFNAAREGTRYGMTNPRDYAGISQRTQDHIIAVPDADVNVWVWYDGGPGDTSQNTDVNQVVVGDRVVVYLQHQVEPLTPLFEPFLNNVQLETRAARTIQTLGTIVSDPPPGPPPPGPTPANTATLAPTETPPPTATHTVTPEYSPTATGTPSPSPSPSLTPTHTPTPAPLEIYEPVMEGHTVVSGTAQTGQSVTLRVVQTGYQATVMVHGGEFIFADVPGLNAGYTVVVQGYGQQDSAVVVGGTPTPTPTFTATPTTPPDAYLTLDATCGPSGQATTITVNGYNFYTSAVDNVKIYWDWNGSTGILKHTIDDNPSDFSVTIQIDAAEMTAGSHVISAQALKSNGQLQDDAEITFVSPCAEPDLVITDLSLLSEEPLGTYEKIDLNVTVKNQGGADVPSLFWVDLYADTAPSNEAVSVDYVAVNGLPAGASISFTMWHDVGFAITGTHTFAALVDTWDQIMEIEELNNASETLTVTVAVTNPVPTPTPTPAVTPGQATIEGITYLEGVPHSLVNVYVYDLEGRLIWSGKSQTVQDEEGNIIEGFYEAQLPPGSYTAEGVMRMADDLYVGETAVNDLTDGEVRQGVSILLSSVY